MKSSRVKAKVKTTLVWSEVTHAEQRTEHGDCCEKEEVCLFSKVCSESSLYLSLLSSNCSDKTSDTFTDLMLHSAVLSWWLLPSLPKTMVFPEHISLNNATGWQLKQSLVGDLGSICLIDSPAIARSSDWTNLCLSTCEHICRLCSRQQTHVQTDCHT